MPGCQRSHLRLNRAIPDVSIVHAKMSQLSLVTERVSPETLESVYQTTVPSTLATASLISHVLAVDIPIRPFVRATTVTCWTKMRERFKREFGVRLGTEWLFSVLKVPCVMRGIDNEFVISAVSFR